MKKFTFLMLFFAIATFGVKAQTITHSNSQDIEANEGIACNNGGILNDNDFYRTFVLADFGIVSPWNVTSIELGVEELTGGGGAFPITVTLYTTDAAFPNWNLTEIGTATGNFADQTFSYVTIPVDGVAAAGSELVVKISVF